MVLVSFLGLRTAEFAAMKRLYVEAYGLPVLHEADGVVWFALEAGAELHVYAQNDTFHAFFATAPVPGLFVADYDETAARLSALGVEWLTEPQTARGRQWRHYRAPDGNVYELMGPGLSAPDELVEGEHVPWARRRSRVEKLPELVEGPETLPEPVEGPGRNAP